MDSNELLDKLRTDIQAQITAENKRTEVEKQRLSELKAIAGSLQRLDKISLRLEKAVNYLNENVGIADALREIAEQLPQHIERLEQLIFVLNQPNSPGFQRITKKLKSEIVDGHIRSLQRQLKQQHDNYNMLQEQSANYAGQPPIELTNRIIVVSQEIERLEAEIKYYKGNSQ